ncbi:MAG TPA: hypothetical protein VE078_05595 [Thermoanaerobaculia bacterium]|nr:hypothetical protein [Thermoanaerobaculia bacterium]
MSRTGRISWLAGALLALAPQIASACSTCFGAADAPMTKGMNSAILLLMACVGVVYVGIGKVAWDFRKRSKRLAEKEPRKPQMRLIRGEKQ